MQNGRERAGRARRTGRQRRKTGQKSRAKRKRDSRIKGNEVEQLPEHTYLAIDLKSFYASVECVSRGLDPMTTNLVVADVSRTEKTICLAVSPSLKAYGIPGRARLFEVIEMLREGFSRGKASTTER